MLGHGARLRVHHVRLGWHEMPRIARRKTATIRYPYTKELEYTRLLKRLVRTLRYHVNNELISIIPQLVAGATPLKLDADDDWADQVNKALAKVANNMMQPIRITQQQLDDIGAGTDDFNERQWRSLVRKAYGVSPTNEDPEQYKSKLDQWADDNARLIKNISDKAINQIRDDTIEALTAGTTIDDLKAIVLERIDVSDSRAELIARDQISKLNGDLTQSRQEDAGVSRYIWRTVMDERVRDSHADCEGEIFTWDSDASEGGVPKPDGNDPGGDYQCRCWPEPILPSRMTFEAELDEAA